MVDKSDTEDVTQLTATFLQTIRYQVDLDIWVVISDEDPAELKKFQYFLDSLKYQVTDFNKLIISTVPENETRVNNLCIAAQIKNKFQVYTKSSDDFFIHLLNICCRTKDCSEWIYITVPDNILHRYYISMFKSYIRLIRHKGQDDMYDTVKSSNKYYSQYNPLNELFIKYDTLVIIFDDITDKVEDINDSAECMKKINEILIILSTGIIDNY